MADTNSATPVDTDSGAPSGTLYVYRIKAINSLSTSGVPSYVNADRGT